LIELLLLSFVIQGDTSGEWIQSCYDQFDPETDYFTPINQYDPNKQEHKDYLFCSVVVTLKLNEHQVEMLGKDINWHNYVHQTAQEFVDNSQYYQSNRINNIVIESVVSGRDSLSPPMSVVISYDETHADLGTSKYYKIYNVNPLCTPEVYDIVCHTDVPGAIPKRYIQHDINNAFYKLSSELDANPDFKKLVDTKLGGFGPRPDEIFVIVNPKYLDTYQLFRYQDTIREIIGHDVPILFESQTGIYCPTTEIAVDGKCQPVNYVDPLYWVILIALIPVSLITVFVLKSERK